MPIASVELIMFAVQAGIKLAQTGRKVYVETTIGGEVDIPLPPSFKKTPVEMALQYANSLAEGDAQAKERFTKDYQNGWSKYESGDNAVRADGGWLLVQQYLTDMTRGLVPFFNRTTAEVVSIFAVNQWERNKSPFPSATQRIAGSLVEVSIDYFLNVPGALNENSKQGKVVKAFLQGLDDFDFQKARWDSIALALFTTALDTFKNHPDLITDDADDQSLIEKIVSGVASDVSNKLKADDLGDLDAEARLKRYGQIVLRSLLKNGGTAILDSPSRLVNDKGGQALVQSVGSAFLDLLLNDNNSSLTIDLRKVASSEGFDKLVHAALKAVVEHPDDFGTGNEAVNIWLKGVLSDLYKWSEAGRLSLNDPELFVEIAYSVIDNGLRDLPLFLKPADGTTALLVDIARRVFDVLTVPPSDGILPRFKSLQLSRSDLKELFNGVLTSLTTNLSWLQKRTELRQEATALIPLIVAVLSDLDEASLKALIRSDQLSTVVATVLASEILKPANNRDKEKIIKGLTKLFEEVRSSGINGCERLLDKNVLFDMFLALVNSDAAAKLFGADQTQIAKVVAALIPVMEGLRQGQILTVRQMVEDIKKVA